MEECSENFKKELENLKKKKGLIRAEEYRTEIKKFTPEEINSRLYDTENA